MTAGLLLASGSHLVDVLSCVVRVPPGNGPFPVVLMLHGLTDSGERMITDLDRTSLPQNHILVAPTALRNNWFSRKNHSFLVSKSLVNYLVEFSNVKPTFKLVGHSQGADLVNQLLIENDDPRIVAAVTVAFQLDHRRYEDGSFWAKGSYEPQTLFRNRSVLQITGGRDDVIPVNGGVSSRTGLTFYPWQEAAYNYAKGYGYKGSRLTESSYVQDDDKVAWVSYLDGQVQACNLKWEPHVVDYNNYENAQWIADFLDEQPLYKSTASSSTNAELLILEPTSVHVKLGIPGLLVLSSFMLVLTLLSRFNNLGGLQKSLRITSLSRQRPRTTTGLQKSLYGSREPII